MLKDTETKSSREDRQLSDPTALAVATETASAHESNEVGRAESAIDEEVGALSPAPDAGPALANDQQAKDGAESEIKEAVVEKEAVEPDDEHMVEGDEDTVIY